MKRVPFFTSLLCFLVLQVHPASAQITGETVILSERVGELVDSSESEKFHVFQNIKGLQSARVIMISDSLLSVVFQIRQPSSAPRVEYQKYSLAVLKVIAEKINHIEGLIDGTYVMGTEPARLRTAAGSSVGERPPPARAGVAGLPAESQAFGRSGASLPAQPLPFSQISASLPMRARYPQFGFTGGIASYEPDAGGLWQRLAAIEEHYRSYGYPIEYARSRAPHDLALFFAATVVFDPSFDVSLEVVRREHVVTYKSIALSGRYFPEKLTMGPLRLFASVGVQAVSYSVSAVQSYHDPIGPADSVGRFMMFVEVDIQGTENVLSWFLGAGLELGRTPAFTPGLSAFVRYVFSPDLALSSSVGEGVVKTEGYLFGVTLTIYFQ